MASVSNRDSVVCATLLPMQEASLLWCSMPKGNRLSAAEEPGGTKIQQLPRCCGCRAASFSAAWALKGKVTCDCPECVAKEIGGKITTRLLQWQWKSNLRVHSHSQTSAVRDSTVIHDDATSAFIRLASQPVQLFSGKLMTAASFCWEFGVRVWWVLEHIPMIDKKQKHTPDRSPDLHTHH